MALKTCTGCGELISDRAKICPKCGVKLITEEDKLISCPECNTEIPIGADACPVCGYPISEEHLDSKRQEIINESPTQQKVGIKATIGKSKKPIIVAGTILVVIVLVLGIISIRGSKLTDTEEYVITNVKKLQNMLKDPDSLKIRGDIIYIEVDDDGEQNCYTYVFYSANNSFGASTTGTAMFKNHRYIGDYSDDTDDLDVTLEEKLEIVKTQLHLAGWNLLAKFGSDPTKSSDWLYAEYVSCKKIAKKLNVEYVE